MAEHDRDDNPPTQDDASRQDTPAGEDASVEAPGAASNEQAEAGQGSVDQALSDAEQSLQELQQAVGGAGQGAAALSAHDIAMLGDVDLNVTIELGRTEMLVEDVLKVGSGSVIELDKLAGDPVDVHVNGRLVARGEVLVLNDNFCIRISEIVADLQEEAQAAASEREPVRPVKQAEAAEAAEAAASEQEQDAARSEPTQETSAEDE